MTRREHGSGIVAERQVSQREEVTGAQDRPEKRPGLEPVHRGLLQGRRIPVGIPEGTGHLGVTFFRPHGERSAMRTSVARAFAENGDAFVLRGNRSNGRESGPTFPPRKRVG
jgi:hypothetical protein